MSRSLKKVLRGTIPTEDQEQATLVEWMTLKGIKFYAIPNGGYRNPVEAVKFRRTGVKSGVPDICIPIASKSHHGLYIELKRQYGGTVSRKQVEWLNYLVDNGYCAEVACGADEAIAIITQYLDNCLPALKDDV